jgi:hypothetical protein
MSIAVACPHCDAKLNVREEFAGRRAKCPKCQKPLDVPAAEAGAARAAAAEPVALSAEDAAASVREALARLQLKPVSTASSAVFICRISRALHYLAPVVFGGLTAYHGIMHQNWLAGASGMPGPLVYWVLLSVGGVLTVMALLSHVGPPKRKPRPGLPLSAKTSPLFDSLLEEIAKRLDVPLPTREALWDATLALEGGSLRLGASALENLDVAQVFGVVLRDLAAQRGAGRRAARAELERLQRLLGARAAGETLSATGQLLAGLGTVGRPIVWPLAVFVRSAAEPELRQAELEADALQAELVGSQVTLRTIQRLRLIEYAVELAVADLAFQSKEKSLEANRVAAVKRNLESLPIEVQQSVLETPVEELPAGDYRPAWRERIEAIQRLAAPGVLKCPAPASTLIDDFESLCRETTWLDCSQRFPQVKRKELK